MIKMIDIHAHLDEMENIDEVIAGAKDSGLVAIIAVGQDITSNEKVLRISARYPGFVYPALGWHPWNLKEAETDAHLEYFQANIDKAVALGEVGLDYHKKVRALADKDLQKRVLREIFRIAVAHAKPALIHSRYAWRDALDLTIETGLEKAVFHWYTGPSSVLREIIERGYYLSATPAVAYHEEHRRAVKECPLERLLLETDSPVVYARGREGEFMACPSDVARSLEGAAVLKCLSREEIAAATMANARKLLGI